MTCQLGPGQQCRNGWHWHVEREELPGDRYHEYIAAVEQCPEWLRVAKRVAELNSIADDDDYTTVERSNARDELRDRYRELKVLQGSDLPPGEPLKSKEDVKKTLELFELGGRE